MLFSELNDSANNGTMCHLERRNSYIEFCCITFEKYSIFLVIQFTDMHIMNIALIMEQCATFDDLINAKEETTILELAA